MAPSVLSSRQGNPTEPIPSDSEGSTDSREEDDDDDEEGWDDVEKDDEDGDTQEVISLLDDRVFPDVASMLAHCRGQHGLDFLAVRQRLQLDFHGSVRLVNYSRFSQFHLIFLSISLSLSLFFSLIKSPALAMGHFMGRIACAISR